MVSWIRGLRSGAGSAARRTALPPSGDPSWWQVMGYDTGPPRSLVQVERRFRRLAALAHPDRGGSAEQMQRLLRARLQARRQLTP